MGGLEGHTSPQGFRYATPFLQPVNLDRFQDYLTFVSEPMVRPRSRWLTRASRRLAAIFFKFRRARASVTLARCGRAGWVSAGGWAVVGQDLSKIKRKVDTGRYLDPAQVRPRPPPAPPPPPPSCAHPQANQPQSRAPSPNLHPPTTNLAISVSLLFSLRPRWNAT